MFLAHPLASLAVSLATTIRIRMKPSVPNLAEDSLGNSGRDALVVEIEDSVSRRALLALPVPLSAIVTHPVLEDSKGPLDGVKVKGVGGERDEMDAWWEADCK